MRGREREPGIHCKFSRLISREFYGFVNSPYSSVNDDANARSIVYSTHYRHNIEETMPALRTLPTVYYALSQLRMSDLKLKDRQQQAIHAIYDRNEIFFLPSSGRVCLLTFLF